MNRTPKAYQWLHSAHLAPLPRIIEIGLSVYGTQEVVGKGSNKTILAWRDEVNAAHPGWIKGYSDDDIPWCGLFVAWVITKSDHTPCVDPLWARNWLNFGNRVQTPGLGDVLVFERGSGGHVGFYIGEDEGAYHVLGGNQSNAVTITRVLKKRLLNARRPSYRNMPASVNPYKLRAMGSISTNEA